jgi:hypothetical protein
MRSFLRFTDIYTGHHFNINFNNNRNLALQVGGVSKTKTIKYAHESRGTQTQERLRWRCPATTENYRPDISSERAPHINKPIIAYENN